MDLRAPFDEDKVVSPECVPFLATFTAPDERAPSGLY